MTQKTQLTLLKFIAVSAAAYYLYHLTKAQGQSMSGRANPEKIAKLGAQLLPQEMRPRATQVGAEIIRRLMM